MLNGDLLKLFRMGAMTRISHFVCQGKYLYPAHDLKYAEVFIFLLFFFLLLLFQDYYYFFSTTRYFWKYEPLFMLFTENILIFTFYIFSS